MAHAVFDQGRGFERGEGREFVISSMAFFSSPGRSPERAIILPPASALALALAAASALAKC